MRLLIRQDPIGTSLLFQRGSEVLQTIDTVIAGGIVAGFLGAVVAVPLVSIIWAVIGEIRRPPDILEEAEAPV